MPAGNRGLNRFAGPPLPGNFPWAGRVNATETVTRRPPACPANAGLLFFATDLGTNVGYTLYRSDGAQWVQVSISPIGATSISVLGTIGTGLWHGTTIGLLYGGTGADLHSTGPGVIRQTTAGANFDAGQALDYILLQDQKSSGTGGGSFTSGSWATRDLNTEVADTGGHCSLSSNQFTLSAGTYRIRASAPALQCGGHTIRLQNVSDATTTAVGTPTFSNTGALYATTRSQLSYRFTIASSKAFEIQHQCGTTQSNTYGRGGANSFGVTEIFTEVELLREIS